MPNRNNFELVKLEPDFDCVAELVKLEQLNAVEDVKIKNESINDETVIKQEFLESIKHEILDDETVIKQEFLESVKHEILDDETVIKQEVLESIKYETVDKVLDGAATDNDPDNTLVSSVLICEYCHKNYTQPQNFDAHIATHHQTELGELKKGRQANKKGKNQRRAKPTVKCDRKTTAEPPIPRYDETREVRSCKYCNKTFAHIVNFGSHVLAAHKDQLEDLNSEITSIIHKCKQCDYETLRLDHFKRHMLHHSGVSLFTCEFCGKGYNIRSYLDSHLLKQHNKEIGATEDVIVSKIYTCKTCEYETVRLNDYKQHILNHHATSTTRALFKCELCNFKSVHKRSLLQHNFVHSGGGKLYSCEFCERAYKQKRNLRARVYAYHKDKSGNLIEAISNTVHQCPNCPYKTMHSSHLKRHHIVTHEKDSELKRLLRKCEVCGYATLDKSRLNRHMLRHSNVKKYACSECDNGFNFKSAIDAHILAKHSDNQELMNSITATMHECSDCSYKTIRTENMNRHRKTHL